MGRSEYIDDFDFAAGFAEDADVFLALALVTILLDISDEDFLVRGVQAEKDGIEDADVGIVHLEVTDVRDAQALHLADGARDDEGFQRAAVAVGIGGDFVLACKEDLAGFDVEAWQDALGEELDAVAAQAEELV